MPTVRQPRAGSLQFWPRKRSKKAYPRVRTFPQTKEKGLVVFAGYKVGMFKLQAIETSKHSHKKGEEISIPVTLLECPPVKIASLRLYKKGTHGLKLEKEIFLAKKDKYLARRLVISKKSVNVNLDTLKLDNYDDARILIFTQPHLTGIGKKMPEIFEVGLGGDISEKIQYVKDNLDKDIPVTDIVKEGQLFDIFGVTKGKGFQGPVRRFGISLRQKKSEKSIRNPGSLGPWMAQGHIMWRVAHAGKMGFHQRIEINKQALGVFENLSQLNIPGGWLNYGVIKNPVVLIKGSVQGSKKRLVFMRKRSQQKPLPTIISLSTGEDK